MDTIRISLLHSKYPISYNKKYISHFYHCLSKVYTSSKNKICFENIYFPSKFIKLYPESLKENTDKISLRSDETQTFYWSFKYVSNYHLKWNIIWIKTSPPPYSQEPELEFCLSHRSQRMSQIFYFAQITHGHTRSQTIQLPQITHGHTRSQQYSCHRSHMAIPDHRQYSCHRSHMAIPDHRQYSSHRSHMAIPDHRQYSCHRSHRAIPDHRQYSCHRSHMAIPDHRQYSCHRSHMAIPDHIQYSCHRSHMAIPDHRQYSCHRSHMAIPDHRQYSSHRSHMAIPDHRQYSCHWSQAYFLLLHKSKFLKKPNYKSQKEDFCQEFIFVPAHSFIFFFNLSLN